MRVIPTYLNSLVKRAKTGDVNAFDKLYRLHVDLIYTHVARFISCEADIKDIASDVFTKVISKLEQFNAQSSFTTWLISITDNAIKNFFRERSRYSNNPIEDTLLESPYATTKTQHIKIIVQEALEILTPNQREVLVLHGLQGYTFKEVAHRLFTTERAVKSRYYLAIEHLRKHLVRNPFVLEYFQGRYKYNEETIFQRTKPGKNSCQLFTTTGQRQKTLY